MLVIIGALLMLIVQLAIAGGITAGIVLLINALAGTDFSLVLPVSIVCGLIVLVYVAQTFILVGANRSAKKFERKHFGGRR